MGRSKNKEEAAPKSIQEESTGSRNSLHRLENKEGEVIALDKSNFGIRPSDGQAMLFPVNLPKELQKNGIKVKFTVQVTPGSLTELWVGRPVLLSRIKKIK